MKIQAVTSLLILVGSCATLSHTEKLENIKSNIVFFDTDIINKYANTITAEELNAHVYQFSSDEFQGRRAGEAGHMKAADFIKDYYFKENIPSPLGPENYYQFVDGDFFPEPQNSSPNVLAFIEGTTFPDEILIITGHSDHEGFTDDIIYNGADDNGSGTAAMLEMAQAFNMAKLEGHGPKRSILFLHLTGEEIDLTGSKYYTQHPIFPLENTVANLNIDMIGRIDEAHQDNPNYIYLIGSDRLSTELHFISEKANETFTKLNLDYRLNSDSDPNQYYTRSDHYSFAQKGVPVIFYFNGTHEDYHEPTDTAEKINYPLLSQRTKLIFTTAWYLANNDERLQVDLDS
ncbi:M28 family peptidase [Psychroserpens sp. XS_ASV72]|uniref:M28 family peptidase n=1 Tax=Psychroserpens sp. XS_ASV72 TaxID=3241293 RepID=UPI0035121ED2